MFCRNRSSSCPAVHFNSFRRKLDVSTLTEEQLKKISSKDNEQMEKLEKYKAGGYIPVELGQEIGPNKEYQVLRKLGWGTFSNVWLCKDKSKQSESYCAMKIAVSSTNGATTSKKEIQVLDRLKKQDPNSIGYHRFVLFYDYFTEKSIYGKHICLKFEAMGKSLRQLMNNSQCQGIQEEEVKAIIRQICEGLQYLHEKCGIIHTDIKPENILVCAEDSYFCNLAAYVEQFKKLGVIMPPSYMSTLEQQQCKSDNSQEKKESPSSTKPVSQDDSYVHIPPKPTLHSPFFVNPNIQIKLSDFGCAIFEKHRHPKVTQPSIYRAFEVFIEAPYSYPVDMWSVGCLTFELCTGEHLFATERPPDISPEEWQLCLIWRVLGGIPKPTALSGRKSSKFFDEAGKLKKPPMDTLKNWTIRHKLVKKHGWYVADAMILEAFIKSLINANPKLRATARTVFEEMWLSE